VGAHGLRGELRVHPSCDSPGFACQFPLLYFDEAGASSVRVLGARPHKNVALLRLEGVSSAEAAEALKSRALYFKRSDARLEEGQYFIAELLGCAVLDAADPARCYGEISGVSKTGANDVWHIKTPKGGEALIPFVPAVVKGVDTAAGRVAISPLPGLF
jgi:16S rRNA processing protein RimM